jgi:hypothetical protein
VTKWSMHEPDDDSQYWLARPAAERWAAAACAGESNPVSSCVVKLGDARTVVSIGTKVGASSVATIGTYSVTFTINDGRQFEAAMRDEDSTLAKVTTGGWPGKASGSTGTPDGELEFSCTP